MNIDKLRKEAAIDYADRWTNGQTHSKLGFRAGAKWEYERTKWVKVEDALPDIGFEIQLPYSKKVLAKNINGIVSISQYWYESKIWSYLSDVTEWCEIPK